jgi:hypothetical protein
MELISEKEIAMIALGTFNIICLVVGVVAIVAVVIMKKRSS